MAVGLAHARVLPVSFMEHNVLDQLLDEIDVENENEDTHYRRPALSTSTPTDAAAVPKPSVFTPSVEAKRIRPELDPLPLAATEARTEYFTVNDYVWPTPPKRECRRMPDDERRQRHRESQREFMTRKRAQFRAMRAEISYLERQLQWLETRRTLKTLTLEQQSLVAKLTNISVTIEHHVWKKTHQ